METDSPDIEEAWYAGEVDEVARNARAAIQDDPSAFAPRAWLGLAQWHEGDVRAARETLREAFSGARHARDEEAEWQRHAACTRLVEVATEADQLQVARFIVEGLVVEHGTSLRLLAEHTASSNPIAALSLVRRALVADPADAEAQYLAAKFFAGLGKRSLALKHLELALENGAGVLAVRCLARIDAEFDGLRADDTFNALIDPLPRPPLRALYAALDAGRLSEVLTLEGTLEPSLDVLYPLREALERLIDSAPTPATLDARLALVNADIDAREDAGELSEAYAKFCGEL